MPKFIALSPAAQDRACDRRRGPGRRASRMPAYIRMSEDIEVIVAHPLRRQRRDIARRHPVTDKLRLSARCFLVRAKQDAEIAVIPGNASRCRNIRTLSAAGKARNRLM